MLVVIITFALWILFFFAFLAKVIQKFTIGVCKSSECLVGKTAIVTGGNSGMGYETSLNLASRGCKVIIADVADSTESVRKITDETGNPNISYKFLDLGSLASVRKFAEDVKAQEPCLDILINNAGVGGMHTFSNDGLFKTMQINHLGPFLLTHLLIDLLKKSKRGRIVFASSFLAFITSLTDPKKLNESAKSRITYLLIILNYGNSKLCNAITTIIMAEKLQNYGITVNCHHPGLVNTGIYSTTFNNLESEKWNLRIWKKFTDWFVYLFGKNPREGAQNNLYCALSEKLETGKFISDCRPFLFPPKTKNMEFCQAVWDESERLVKLAPEEKLV